MNGEFANSSHSSIFRGSEDFLIETEKSRMSKKRLALIDEICDLNTRFVNLQSLGCNIESFRDLDFRIIYYLLPITCRDATHTMIV